LSYCNAADRAGAAEAALIEAAQKGDRPAFAGLVERYWDRLYRWLYRLSRDRHAAEDLAQETFLKAFAGLASFRAGTNFQAWLFRIGYNNFVNQRRRGSRARQPFPDEVAGGGAGPAEEAIRRETLQLLARTVGKLPHEYRAAFLLRVEEGLSFREIADVLATTEETARWRVFKARQKLLSVLGPELDWAAREKP
jgi:RNA polymerase sigma-70 factor (ECF subfamily)